MALHKREDGWYGDSQSDIRGELLSYSEHAGYVIDHFADVVCSCGNREFQWEYNETIGVAIRRCTACRLVHPMGDSDEYLDDEADLDSALCLCDFDIFEITVGVSLYEESEDVRWLYLGCRCVNCGLVGCYADWKNEYNGYRKLLEKM